MSAKPTGPIESFGAYENYTELEKDINGQLESAVMAGAQDERYMYVTLSNRLEVAHSLAVICVADTVEPLRARKPERLRFAIPIHEPDAQMPVSVLGDESHTFFLTYLARRGGLKTLRMTPAVYQHRFQGRRKPPVVDFGYKAGSYQVVPMRQRENQDGLTGN